MWSFVEFSPNKDGDFHRHGGNPQKRWWVFVNGKLPSFDSWMMTRGSPISGHLHVFKIHIYSHTHVLLDLPRNLLFGIGPFHVWGPFSWKSLLERTWWFTICRHSCRGHVWLCMRTVYPKIPEPTQNFGVLVEPTEIFTNISLSKVVGKHGEFHGASHFL